MQTRIIYTEIWQDDFFVGLNPDEKLLFIYYLTNESVNIIHFYKCGSNRVKADTGIDTPIILQAQQKFEKEGKIFFKNGYVFLRNAHRFERYEGSKNEIAKSKLFARLSKDLLDWYSKLTDTPIDTLYKSETINKKSETLEHKPIQTEEVNPNDIPF
jgi:hypothetical protein